MLWREWKFYKKSNSKNYTDFFIRYINSIEWIDSIIIGFNKKKEIIENLSYINNKKISKKIIQQIDESKIKINEKVLNPANWKV